MSLHGTDTPSAAPLRKYPMLQKMLTRAYGQIVNIIDLGFMRAVIGGKSFLQPSIVMVKRRAAAPHRIGVREHFRKHVRSVDQATGPIAPRDLDDQRMITGVAAVV